MARRPKEPQSVQRLHAPFPFTPEEVRQIRNGMLTTLETGYRRNGSTPGQRLHDAEVVNKALRSLEKGAPNAVVKRPVLNDLFAAAWVSFQTSRICGRDEGAARRAAAVLVQMHLEFHLGILGHTIVGPYYDNS